MQLTTKHFGEVDYNKDDVITFEEGLPGFRGSTCFILLADSPGGLIHWLQSTEDGDLAFVLMDVKQILPGYSPNVEPEMLESLADGGGPGSLSYYNIAVVPDDLRQMRVNLKAPIVINMASKRGKQSHHSRNNRMQSQ